MSSSGTKPNEDRNGSEIGSPNNMNVLTESSVDFSGNINSPAKPSGESMITKKIVPDNHSLPSTSTGVEKHRIQRARKSFPKPSGLRQPLNLKKTNVPGVEAVAGRMDKSSYEVKHMDVTAEVDSDTTTTEILCQSELTCQPSPDSVTSKPVLLLSLESQNEEKMPTLQSAANGKNSEHDRRMATFYSPKADEKLVTNGDSSSDRILKEGDRERCLDSMSKNLLSGLSQSSKDFNPSFVPESPIKKSNVRVVPMMNPTTSNVHPHPVIRQTSSVLEGFDMPNHKRQRLDSSGSSLDPLSVKDVDVRPVEDGNESSERRLADVSGTSSSNAPTAMLSTSSPKPSSNNFKLFSPTRTLPVDSASNVEAAMAALHGETDDLLEDNTLKTDDSSDFDPTKSPSPSDSEFEPTSSFSQKKRKKGRKPNIQNPTIKAAASKDAKAKPSGKSRELASLRMDEGAVRIHRELEGNPERRRVPRKELQIENPAPRTRKSDGRSKKRRASKESSDNSERRRSKPLKKRHESNVQEEPINNWQPEKNGVKVVYYPKLQVNPENKLVPKRLDSTSSDSSEGTSSKPRNLKPISDSPRFRPLSPASYLAEGGGVCASGVNNNVIEKPIVAQDELTIKLNEDYKEIQLRCTNRLLHVTLSPTSSKLRNSLNPTILREITSLLRKLKTEEEITTVLFTSASDRAFCTGIDLYCLLSDSESERRIAADSMTILIQHFILELANCDKLLVCGLSGNAIGLGVAMLPYFDLVFASEKSRLYLLYDRLGQPSEGGLCLTLLSSPRNPISLMFFAGFPMTTTEAEHKGLVNEILFHNNFQELLMPRVHAIATQLSPNTLLTKKAVRASLRRDLPDVLKEESELLKQSWTSDEFQRRARNLLDSRALSE